MPFQGQPNFRHDGASRCGVLLVNLGTPDAPRPREVRRYLAEFLSDPRVIELPRLFWLPLLHGVILPFRARRSAHAYSQVWTTEGSPLLSLSNALAAGLQASFDETHRPILVRTAMRYGNPSISTALSELRDAGVRRLLVLPLYPQYSATTTASVFDAMATTLMGERWLPELRFINDYFSEPSWAAAVSRSIREHWDQHGRGDHLLFSFHGIPKRYFQAGDPYFCHCQASARAITERLGLPRSAWSLSFQSRVGREEWLRPYTDETVGQLATQGVRKLDVVCPGFAVDCLETLEEIAMENADTFVGAGGESLRYIPALNAGQNHIDALLPLIERHLAGWPEGDAEFVNSAAEHEAAARNRRFSQFETPPQGA
ncbi:MAG TPA: ferrochelatase [Aquimonas sp.]|nr:ferrochelatase [Aquimonas sp.]